MARIELLHQFQLFLSSWKAEGANESKNSHTSSLKKHQKQGVRTVHRKLQFKIHVYKMFLTVESFFFIRKKFFEEVLQCIIQRLFQKWQAKQTKFFTVRATVVDPRENKSPEYPRTKSRQNPPLLIGQFECGISFSSFQAQLFIHVGKNKKAWRLPPALPSPLLQSALPWQKKKKRSPYDSSYTEVQEEKLINWQWHHLLESDSLFMKQQGKLNLLPTTPKLFQWISVWQKW